MKNLIFGLLSLTLLLKPGSPASEQQKWKTVVGPDVLVSRDGDFPHFEILAASNPKNPKNVLGTSITYDRPYGGQACKTYASTDGGYTWQDTFIPDQVKYGGGDPQVAFGPNGTAYFTSLTWAKDEKGKAHGYLYCYRSEDGGLTWSKPADLGYSYDHEQIAIDRTYGKYAGRIYLGVMYGEYPDYRVGLFRSEDDGRTYVGPVLAFDAMGNTGLNVHNPVVLSDGTVFLPYTAFAIKAEERKTSTSSPFYFVTSTDGGVTFSSPTKIGDQYYGSLDEMMKPRVTPGKSDWWARDAFPMYAVDSSGKYRDRIYVAWTDKSRGNPRLLFIYSSDKGKTWSTPKLVSADVPDNTMQFQPAITVNNQGVVGITWFDTRDSQKQDSYCEYFASSIDGGDSFLPAVKVSTEPSVPMGAGNLRPNPWGTSHQEKSVQLIMSSDFSFRPAGGDYMGLTSDSDGVFHPLWVDSRSGTAQMWTARIEVRPEEMAGQDKKPAEPQKVEENISRDIDFVLDPAHYDPDKNEVVIPVRLTNISGKKLYGPFTVMLQDLVHPGGDEAGGNGSMVSAVMNSSNGKTGEGATFDYPATCLRDNDSLEPGAMTLPVVWRFKVRDPVQTDFLTVKAEVRGFVSK